MKVAASQHNSLEAYEGKELIPLCMMLVTKPMGALNTPFTRKSHFDL